MSGLTLRITVAAVLAFWISGLSPVRSAWSGQDRQDGELVLPGAGEPAPDFSLKDFKGRDFSLSRLKGRKVVLLWFTNLCPGCQSSFPIIEKIRNSYAEKGVEIAAVSILGGDRKTAEDIIRRKKVAFNVLYDPQSKVTKLYSGETVPNTCPLQNLFIISKTGKIVYADHYPGIDEAELRSLLDKAAKGEAK